MKRHSDSSIIPKIIVILGTVSVLGIILLFLRSRPTSPIRAKRPETPEKLFTQVIKIGLPKLKKLWEEGDKYFPQKGVSCTQEILHEKTTGRAYYQCNPHFWQCFWSGGVKENPSLEVEAFGQKYHLSAKPVAENRFIEFWRGPGLALKYGYKIEIIVQEIPGMSQPMLLADSCRDTWLPTRIYGYSKPHDKRDDGFLWDNFGRQIFIDRFYVSNRQANEWRRSTGKPMEENPKLWPLPALLNRKEQLEYCAFLGKRPLEAKLFDAASMTPPELKNPLPEKVPRPAAPWQRDLSKTFLGMARINPDYQLTPLDCELAQVQGCQERHFTTDSATWMGMNYALGFSPEALRNFIEPEKNLKRSSRFYAPASTWHELGLLDSWNGEQNPQEPVAFRCYEEVSL